VSQSELVAQALLLLAQTVEEQEALMAETLYSRHSHQTAAAAATELQVVFRLQ